MTDKVLDDRKRGWYWIDNAIIDQYAPIISSDGVSVYNVLARLSDENGRCYPALRYIAEHLHLSRNTVLAALKRLTDVGLITVASRKDPRGDPTSNLYTLLEIRGGTSTVEGGVLHQLKGGTSPVDHEQDLINKTEAEEEKTSDQLPQSLDTPLSESDPLWERCLDQLRLQMTRATYDTWLRNTTAQRTDGRLIVTTANRNGVDWLDKRLRPLIERTVAAISIEPLTIEFITQPSEVIP